MSQRITCLFLSAMFLHCVCGSSTSQAQSLWTLTTADFKSETVVLNSVDPAGLHVTRAGTGNEATVSFAQFLQISRGNSVAKSAKFTLYLAGGDRLNGEPTGMRGEQLIWSSPLLGELSVPLRNVLSLTAAGKKATEDRPREDVVILSNGDSVRGIVAGLADAKLSVQAQGQTTEVPLTSVASISFAATGGKPPAAPGFRVRLDDGTAVTTPTFVLQGDKLQLSIEKQPPRTVDASHVLEIEQINGPVSWLSARPPAEAIYTPFFGTSLAWPAKMDRSVEGTEIRFKEQTFSRGIGVHAYSRLTWPLDGTFEAFRTRYAVDGDGALADVNVRIRLDDKVVYEQQHVRAGLLSPVVGLDLGSAKTLTLEVDFGSSGDTQDRFNWIEPALLRHKPAPETPAATEPTPATLPSTNPS